MRLKAGDGSDQLQARAHRVLGIMLMGPRIAEIHQHAVAHILRHEPAEAADRVSDTSVIVRNDFPQVFRVQAGGERGRTDQVAEHDRDLATLGGIIGGMVRRTEERAVARSRERAGRRWRRAACGGVRRCRRPDPSGPPPSGSARPSSSIALFRNASSYCARPRLRSQPPTSMMTPASVPPHDRSGETSCPGRRFQSDRTKSRFARLGAVRARRAGVLHES